MSQIRKPAAALAALAGTALAAAGGGSTPSHPATPPPAAASPSSTASGSSGASAAALGTPKKATGSPYVFGVINDETGPASLPEARPASVAAAGCGNKY